MTARDRADRMALLAEVDRQIGARLRDLRRARGLTQAAVGEVVGVASQQVAKYETGDNAIAASRLFLLAGALGVEAGVFFEGLDQLLAGGAAGARNADVTRAIEAQQEGVELASVFRRISDRRTRALLLTLSRELAKA